MEPDEWLYLVNFYDQLDSVKIDTFVSMYKRVIVDQAHGYFSEPTKDADTIYTCRKFFGVPDGAFLYTDVNWNEPLEQDESFERLHYLAGRFERTASDFYSEFTANEVQLDGMKILRMSQITDNLLRGIDYSRALEIRKQNFQCLQNHLDQINLLKPRLGTFMYPLMVENASAIRNELIAQKIYIPTLWPDVLRSMPEDSLEFHYTSHILPLPIDQRYGIEEMTYLCNYILEHIKG